MSASSRSRLLALCALGSGVALVVHILSGVSLRWAFAATLCLVIFAVASLWRRRSSAERAVIARVALVGLLSGLAATVAYDASKYALSQFDASPYDPFEAIRVFGVLLAGPAAPTALALAAGTAFHLLNGLSFGIAYCFLFGRRGVVAGVAWGLALEIFQLTLYPGWLDVRFYREFVQISGLSHIIYGLVLGACCRRGLRHTIGRQEPL